MARDGAHTPKELEVLLEDAAVMRDRDGLAALFEEGAVLIAGDGAAEARGEDVACAVEAMWEHGAIPVADPRRVLQAGDTAIVLGPGRISVARGAPTGDGGTRSRCHTTTRPHRWTR